MKMRVQVILEQDNERVVEEVACLQRGDLSPESLGLSLAEVKQLLAAVQRTLVGQQVEEYVASEQYCPECGRQWSRKDNKTITMRTVFGKLKLCSPRFYTCSCQPVEKSSFSPLAQLLPERSTPELKYLQVKWASLMSYGLSVDVLEEVLPLNTNTFALRSHVDQVANRLEEELGAEQESFIEGNFLIWDQSPEPASPLKVGIDGGYVRARDEVSRKAGSFEVIVGKSIPEEGDAKRFAFVHNYDEKPKRRLVETLKTQGLSMRQAITFLSDGGDTVRNLQLNIAPYAEHILDWFHVTMRITVMKQMTKSFADLESLKDLESAFDSVKWYLWHGNVFSALQRIQWILMDLECLEPDQTSNPERFKSLCRKVSEFESYITHNQPYIPSYADRYQYGEPIATAFVESTVNEVISRRMVKKQQMRWTQKGAHLLLQIRTRTLNDDLKTAFCRWYPGMTDMADELPLAV